MRTVVALCSVKYAGRGDTSLDSAVRAILVKADGSVSIHNDKGNKPLNYMGAGCVHSETVADDGGIVWFFDTRKESLIITLHEVYSDVTVGLDEGTVELVRDGTESHLQKWLSEHPEETFGPGWRFLEREFKTGVGGLDLLMADPDGVPVAVEVKRTATPNSVYQVIRYVDAMRGIEGFENVYGLVVAVDLRPNMVTLAEKKNIITVTVPPFWRNSN